MENYEGQHRLNSKVTSMPNLPSVVVISGATVAAISGSKIKKAGKKGYIDYRNKLKF